MGRHRRKSAAHTAAVPPATLAELAAAPARPSVAAFVSFAQQAPAAKELKHRRDIVAAYEDFWRSVKFRKGWAQPPFALAAARPVLQRAAAVVARIRAFLDFCDPAARLRMVDGSAREFLWTCTAAALDEPQRLAHDLVHATFRDANGYVEGLTGELIDGFIDALDAACPAAHLVTTGDDHPLAAPRDDSPLHAAWSDVRRLAERVLVQHDCARLTDQHRTALQTALEQFKQALAAALDDLSSPAVAAAADAAAASPASPSSSSPTSPSPGAGPSAADSVSPKLRQVAVVEAATDLPSSPEMDASSHAPVGDGGSSSGGGGGGGDGDASAAVDAMQTDPPEPAAGGDSAGGDGGGGGGGGEDDAMSTSSGEAEPLPAPSEESLLKIRKVADDVKAKQSGIVSLQETSRKLDHRAWESARSGREAVEKLQKQCLQYSEELLRDLFSLDAIVNEPQLRPVRREQVQAIQAMINDVDTINQRLRRLHDELRQREEEDAQRARKAREAEQPTASAAPAAPSPSPAGDVDAAAAAPASDAPEHEKRTRLDGEAATGGGDGKPDAPASAAAPAAAASATPGKPATAPATALGTAPPAREEGAPTGTLASRWRQLKLKPRFEVKETLDSFVIAGYVPGMRKSDIDLSLSQDRRLLTVSGLREPGANDVAAMRMQVREMLHAYPVYRGQDENTLMLKAGVGRFGRFQETYELPPGVDADAIQASYEGGVLRVVVPKTRAPRYSQPPMFGAGVPQRGGAAARHAMPGYYYDDDGDMPWW